MEDFISKLPYILASLMGLIVGITGFMAGKDNYYIYTSMLVSILVFGIIGIIAKMFLVTLLKDEENISVDNNKVDELTIENDEKGSIIDLRIDDSSNPQINEFFGEDFSPLEVSKVIRTNIAND